MNKVKIITFIVIFFVAVAVFSIYALFGEKGASTVPMQRVQKGNLSVKSIDFSKINSEFLFSAEVNNEFEAEYISQLRAINVYNPGLPDGNNMEKSQIYITFFRANRFLTLDSVEITQREPMVVKGREAILYEITKKSSIPDFLGQPSWRNLKHKALDVRFTKTNPSYFYAFAYNPDLPENVFNDFINSLAFYN